MIAVGCAHMVISFINCVQKSAGANSAVTVQMWKYEGRSTLDHFLRRRDCVPALADALGIEQAAVVPTVMKQVLEGIAVSMLCDAQPDSDLYFLTAASCILAVPPLRPLLRACSCPAARSGCEPVSIHQPHGLSWTRDSRLDSHAGFWFDGDFHRSCSVQLCMSASPASVLPDVSIF